MTRYLEQLNETTDPVTGDYLPIYDASAGSTDKDRKVNISRFAILATANTFTALQTFAPGTDVNGLTVNMATGHTSDAALFKYNNTTRIQLRANSTTAAVILNAADNTTGVGQFIQLSRNNNASTPAAGFLYFENRAGTAYFSWPDSSGNMRVGTSLPTNANDATGTVIGTQTSSLASKNVIDEFTDYDGALSAIVSAPVYDFTYKSGAFGGEKFTGIITDFSPVFGMDKDDEHPAGKSLNTVNGFGYTVAAFKALEKRIRQLEMIKEPS